MQRDMIWQNLDTSALEHHRFTDLPDGSKHANGLSVGVIEDIPFRLRYHVALDERWHVREVKIIDLIEDNTVVRLGADGEGHWTNADGSAATQFDGCMDIDFTATPFTNTLPIQRLGRQVGITHEIDVVYIVHPEFEIYPAKQFYTCLSADEMGARYHFKMDDFERDITVDPEGFVTDYPDLFQRTWAKVQA
jgi:uncharacterized protein